MIGSFRHCVRVQQPTGAPDPNGDGGYTDPWVNADPPLWFCQIVEGGGNQERPVAGSTIAAGTHLLRGHYRADITVRDRIIVNDAQVFNVVSVANPGFLNKELIVACVAIEETAVPPPPSPVPQTPFYQDPFMQQQQGWAQTYGTDT